MPDFYNDEETRKKTFDEIHKLDKFLAFYGNFQNDLTGIHNKLLNGISARGHVQALKERLLQLEKQLERIQLIADSRNILDLGDALLCLTLVDRIGKVQNALVKIAQMYATYTKKLQIDSEMLAELFNAREDRLFLHISGLGAYALMKGESGLHRY